MHPRLPKVADQRHVEVDAKMAVASGVQSIRVAPCLRVSCSDSRALGQTRMDTTPTVRRMENQDSTYVDHPNYILCPCLIMNLTTL